MLTKDFNEAGIAISIAHVRKQLRKAKYSVQNHEATLWKSKGIKKPLTARCFPYTTAPSDWVIWFILIIFYTS